MKKTGSDESLGEHGDGQRCVGEIEPRRLSILKAGEKCVEREGEEESEQRFRDEEAGEEKDADGGEDGESGVEGGAVSPGAARPCPGQRRRRPDTARETGRWVAKTL